MINKVLAQQDAPGRGPLRSGMAAFTRHARHFSLLASALVMMGGAGSAHAQSTDDKFWAHVGPVGILFDSSTRLNVGGQPVDSASAKASNNFAAGIEAGYEFYPSVIASFTVGSPPTTTLRGKGGPVDGVALGKVKYGPAVLSVHYHFDTPYVKPYVGIGVNRTDVLESQDAAVSGLSVKSAWGSVLQAGFDMPITKQWGVFFDVKKIYLKTRGSGTVPAFGGPPAVADIRLDPLLLMGGLSMRF